MSNKTSNWLKIISSVFLVCSGIWLSFKLPYFEYGFFSFAIGHILLIIVLLKQKEINLAVPQILFLGIDFVGIYRWVLS